MLATASAEAVTQHKAGVERRGGFIINRQFRVSYQIKELIRLLSAVC